MEAAPGWTRRDAAHVWRWLCHPGMLIPQEGGAQDATGWSQHTGTSAVGGHVLQHDVRRGPKRPFKYR
jgi:hypothetical protein